MRINWSNIVSVFSDMPKAHTEIEGSPTSVHLPCQTNATRLADRNLQGFISVSFQIPRIQSPAGYSFWTNTAYRAPLIFSGISCLAGNLVLCVSYDTKLLPLLYLARLVTGVGAQPFLD